MHTYCRGNCWDPRRCLGSPSEPTGRAAARRYGGPLQLHTRSASSSSSATSPEPSPVCCPAVAHQAPEDNGDPGTPWTLLLGVWFPPSPLVHPPIRGYVLYCTAIRNQTEPQDCFNRVILPVQSSRRTSPGGFVSGQSKPTRANPPEGAAGQAGAADPHPALPSSLH